MRGIVRNKHCNLIAINGSLDHVHILVDLHAAVAVADLVKALKQSSNRWIRDRRFLPLFEGWAPGYFAASVSEKNVVACFDYINNQSKFHEKSTFFQELERLCRSCGLEWDPEVWE